MKANEAPEKFYLLPNGFISYFRNSDEDIEYTRTDAFIEKVYDWITQHIEDERYKTPDEESYRHGQPYDYFETNMFIDDFRKAMEE